MLIEQQQQQQKFITMQSLGWSGGALVLGKFPVPGSPTYLDKSRAVGLAVGAGGGCSDIFFLLSIISLFILPLSGRRSDID